MSVRDAVNEGRRGTPASRAVCFTLWLSLAACSSKESTTPPVSKKSDTVSAAGDTTYSVFQSRVFAGGPSARWQSSMVFDQANGKAVLFGGRTQLAAVAETWTYDGTWTKCSGSSCTSGPGARGEAGFAYSPGTSTAILFGGFAETTLCDTWEWNGANSTWTARSTPTCTLGSGITAGRLSPAMAGFGDSIALFGGFVESGSNYPPSDESFVWKQGAWAALCDASCVQRSSNGLPPARGEATLTHVTIGSNDGLFLFGGRGTAGFLDDLWEYEIAAARWVRRHAAPGTRARHGAAFDPVRGKLFVHGGCTTDNCNDPLDAEEYDPVADSWSTIAPPGITGPADKKNDFGIAFDSKRRRIVEFGGFTYPNFRGETVEYHTRGSTCASDAECHTGVCSKKVSTDATGICAEPCPNGASDDWNGPCVDDFRCNEVCDQKCRTCSDVPGVCSPVQGKPDGDTCKGNFTCGAEGDCQPLPSASPASMGHPARRRIAQRTAGTCAARRVAAFSRASSRTRAATASPLRAERPSTAHST